MSKKVIQATLQKVLGFDNYLFVFSLYILYTIRWNKKEGDINYFTSLLNTSDTVLDIGANVGIMTALLARRCSKGKIIAVEPIPDNVKALKRLIGFLKLDNVEVFPAALGDAQIKLEMRMPVIKGVKMQGLSHVYHPDVEGYETTFRSYEVDQYTLDELIGTRRVQAIKMDVENYEYYVLKGGGKLIARDRPIIYTELWDNENRTKCMNLLSEIGYKPFVLMHDKLEPFDDAIHSHQNFFFINSN